MKARAGKVVDDIGGHLQRDLLAEARPDRGPDAAETSAISRPSCQTQGTRRYRKATHLAMSLLAVPGIGQRRSSAKDRIAVTAAASIWLKMSSASSVSVPSQRHARDYLAVAISNLAQALLMLGAWDAAEAELTQATDADGLADNEFLACYRGWLAALRGDSAAAQTMLAAMPDLRASEEPQDKTMTSLVEAFTATSRGQPQDALRLARGTLAHVGALGISGEHLRWAWPLAARAAHELGDTAATGELLALLDACQPGHLAPM